MWQKPSDLARTLFTFGETLQQNRADIKELQREVRQLSMALQLLARDVQHGREKRKTRAREDDPPVGKSIAEVRASLTARQR